MPRRFTNVIILAEDRRQCSFARRFLERRGVHRRRIREKTSPRGRGSGEQFVRLQFPFEVDGMRRRSHQHICLVAIVDCDTFSAVDRYKQLEEGLLGSQLTPCESAEAIAVLTPRRNIETWIYYLLGNPVDEQTDYSNAVRNDDIRPAVDEFARRCPQLLNGPDVPSTLRNGCDEFQRVLRLQSSA